MNPTFLFEVFIYSICLGAGLLCFFNFKKLNRAFRWLGVFLVFAGISQIFARILLDITGSNLRFYNYAILINTILIFMVFINIQAAKATKLWLRSLFVFGFLITLFFVWESLENEEFSILGLATMSVTVAIASLIVLFGMLRNPLQSSPLKMGWMWMLMGFLFYYSSSFSYWTAYHFASENITRSALQNVNIVLILIFYLILLTSVIIQLKFGTPEAKRFERKRTYPKKHE